MLYQRQRCSDDPARPNTTFPVLSLRTIMTSYEHPRIDVLRLKVGSNHEWKVLKNLVNTGVLQEIRQLSLHLRMDDPTMWEVRRRSCHASRSDASSAESM